MLLPALQTFVERNGWRAACSLLGLVALVVLLPLNLLLRRRPEELGLAPDGDADTPAATHARRVNVVDPAWAAIDWQQQLSLQASDRYVSHTSFLPQFGMQ